MKSEKKCHGTVEVECTNKYLCCVKKSTIDVSLCSEKRIAVLSFSKLSFKVASAYMLQQSSDICLQKIVIC